MKLTLSKLAGCAILAAASVSAHAAPITGTIGFGSGFTPMAGGSEVNLGSATYIDVTDDTALVTGAGTDALAGLTFGTVVTYNDFTIGGVPVSPLWAGSGFNFELTEMSVVEQSNSFLELIGEGIMSAAGYDDTTYAWSFSGDTSGGGNFVFSSTNTPVPEPGTLALLGLGLAGLGAARRRMA